MKKRLRLKWWVKPVIALFILFTILYVYNSNEVKRCVAGGNTKEYCERIVK